MTSERVCLLKDSVESDFYIWLHLFLFYEREGLYVTEQEVERRLTSLEVRMNHVEPIVQEIKTLSESLVQMVEQIKVISETVQNLDRKVDKMDKRVDEIELAPAKAYNVIKDRLISSLVGVVGGGLGVGLIMLIAQNI